MRPTIDQLMSSLGCSKFPKRWRDIYDEAADIYEKGDNPLLRSEYYDELNEKYRIFEDGLLDIYKKAATLLSENEYLSRFFCILCRSLKDRSTIQCDIAQMELPSPKNGEDILPYDMLTALAMCQSTPDFYAQMVAHNVPQRILLDSLKIPVKCVEYHNNRNARPRLTSFEWYQHAYDGKLYRVGRLQLEFPLGMPEMYRVFENEDGKTVSLANMTVHRDGFPLGSRNYEDAEGSFTATVEETDQYYEGYPFESNGHVSLNKIKLPKSDWSVKLERGDLLVGLHIPPNEPFGNDVVEEALTESVKLLEKNYPEYKYKAFFCGSWLLDPALVEILGEDANISKFCKRFIPFGVKSAGTSPFGYVFHKYGDDLKIEDFPENSRLQRALKRHYLSGKAIYDMHGVFFTN